MLLQSNAIVREIFCGINDFSTIVGVPASIPPNVRRLMSATTEKKTCIGVRRSRFTTPPPVRSRTNYVGYRVHRLAKRRRGFKLKRPGHRGPVHRSRSFAPPSPFGERAKETDVRTQPDCDIGRNRDYRIYRNRPAITPNSFGGHSALWAARYAIYERSFSRVPL